MKGRPEKIAALMGSSSAWVLSGGGPAAAIDMDFRNGRYFGRTPAGLTVVNATGGTANYANGNYTSFAANRPRITDLGLLVEESRTNGIRNNSMAGAVAGVLGSGGSLPTNWTYNQNGSLVTCSVVGTGVASGMNFIDLKFQGTVSGSNEFQAIFFEPDNSSSAPASYGQTWTASVFTQLTAGSFAGFLGPPFSLWLRGNNGGFVEQSAQINLTPAATLARTTASFTFANTSTTAANLMLQVQLAASQTVNATVRFAWPQLELNPNAYATAASAVKAANGASGVNGSGVYQVNGGSGTAATLNCTWAAGVLTVNSVASAGSYTTFPPSPATLTYVSGAATGWTGATVNLTPTDNSAQGFATSPIVTSSAALSRAADVVTLTSAPAFGSSYSTFAKGTPQATTSYGAPQTILNPYATNASNELAMRRNSAGAIPFIQLAGGTGLVLNASGNPTWAQGASCKWAASLAAGAQAEAFNGGSVATGSAATLPTAPTTVEIGSEVGSLFWNGFVERFALWPSTALSNAQLQAITT